MEEQRGPPHHLSRPQTSSYLPERPCTTRRLPTSITRTPSGSSRPWYPPRTFLNDYNATTSFPASVGYSSTLSGGFVIYRQYASDNVWFDRWTTPTDVAEKVIRADNFNLNGRTLTTSHPVRIYSVSGRLVGEGTGTFTLKPGMYLITHENGTSKLVVR